MAEVKDLKNAGSETKNQDFKDMDVESLGEEHINLVFMLGNENFGVDVNIVSEIVRVPSFITRVPNAPMYIKGVMNLRGNIVPVFDMQLKIGMIQSPLTEEARIIVLSIKEVMFGIIVNSVTEVRTIYDTQLEPATKLSSSADKRHILWVAKPADERLILLLDVSSLFELDQILQEDSE